MQNIIGNTMPTESSQVIGINCVVSMSAGTLMLHSLTKEHDRQITDVDKSFLNGKHYFFKQFSTEGDPIFKGALYMQNIVQVNSCVTKHQWPHQG